MRDLSKGADTSHCKGSAIEAIYCKLLKYKIYCKLLKYKSLRCACRGGIAGRFVIAAFQTAPF